MEMNRFAGIVGSYTISAITFLESINWIGAVTGLAGATLTLTMALKTWEEYRTVRLNRQKLEKGS